MSVYKNLLFYLFVLVVADSCVSARFAGYGQISIENVEGNSVVDENNLSSSNEIISITYDIKSGQATIKNNSDNIMYVDKAQSFYIGKDGNSTPLFSNTVTTVSKTEGNASSVNLGPIAGALGIGGTAGAIASGINVGSSSATGTMVQQVEQQIVTIPPHGLQIVKIAGKGSHYRVGGNKPHVIEYNSSDSPLSCEYFFSYSLYSNNEIKYYAHRDRLYMVREEYTHAVRRSQSADFQSNHNTKNTYVGGNYYGDVANQVAFGTFLATTFPMFFGGINITLAGWGVSAAIAILPQILPLGYNTHKTYYTADVYL